MVDKIVTLAGEKIRLESNAYSLILYEDTFKSNFSKDYSNIILGANGEVKTSNSIRFVWLLIKTANPEYMDFEEFARTYTYGDVYEIIPTAIALIAASFTSTKPKKRKATALRGFVSRLVKSLHTPAKSD